MYQTSNRTLLNDSSLGMFLISSIANGSCAQNLGAFLHVLQYLAYQFDSPSLPYTYTSLSIQIVIAAPA